MKQPKEGFYMGIRKMNEDGQMVAIENTYGLARTAFIWTAYMVGGIILLDAGVKVTKQTVKTIKAKIEEHKNKRDLESE